MWGKVSGRKDERKDKWERLRGRESQGGRREMARRKGGGGRRKDAGIVRGIR